MNSSTLNRPLSLTRRQFLRRASVTAATLAAAPMIVPGRVRGADGQAPPSQKVRLAAIGAGGMGGVDLGGLAPHCEVVALCDVDWRHAAESFAKFPSARKFKDFRKMFDAEAKNFDAVLVATPDHFHAVAAMAAIQHGKHVYCEKPLAHSVGEVRALMKAAKEKNVVTQLGNQGHSFNSIRDCVEWIQAGTIGQVHTIHCGANAVNSGLDQLPNLKQEHEVPSTLDWDLWLGPASFRSYHPAYLPGSWRGWTPFGNGTLGDWVCHVVDPVFWALDLGAPKSIAVDVKDYDPKDYDPKGQSDAFPKGDIVTFEFPAKGSRGPVTLKWYSGTQRVPRHPDMPADEQDIGAGAVVMGDKGTLVYGSHGAGGVHLVPDQRMEEFKRPPQTIPRVRDHYTDFVEAIRDGRKAGSDFAYGGALTEVGLLGVIAIKLPGTRLEWDAANMKFTHSQAANALVAPPARKGWKV